MWWRTARGASALSGPRGASAPSARSPAQGRAGKHAEEDKPDRKGREREEGAGKEEGLRDLRLGGPLLLGCIKFMRVPHAVSFMGRPTQVFLDGRLGFFL